MASFGIFGLALPILFLVPAWVGAVALRKATSQSGAKVIFIGCVLATVGIVATIALGLATSASGRGPDGLQIALMITAVAIPLGVVVFMIGFALHGLQVGRVVARITELETIAAAQQEELNRLQAKG